MTLLPDDKTIAEGGALQNINVMRVRYGDYYFSRNSISKDEQFIYNEDGIQLKWIEYTFVIEGYEGGSVSANDPTNADFGPSTYDGDEFENRFSHNLEENVRRSLSKQGEHLTIDMGGGAGDFLYDFNPAGNQRPTTNENQTYDVLYGPKPMNISFIKGDLMAGRILKFTWTVKVVVKPRDSHYDTNNKKGILSFYFKEIQSLDMNFLMTRTIRGTITAIKGRSVAHDDFRAYATPKVKNGFKRTQSSYDINQTGSIANFTFVDKEVYRPFDQPITDGNATFTVQRMLGGAIFTLQGKFSAPKKNGNKDQILVFIEALANEKFGDVGFTTSFNPVTNKIDESIYSNTISFIFSGRIPVIEEKFKPGQSFRRIRKSTVALSRSAMNRTSFPSDTAFSEKESLLYDNKGTANMPSVTHPGDYADETYIEIEAGTPGLWEPINKAEFPTPLTARNDGKPPEELMPHRQTLEELVPGLIYKEDK